MLARIWELPDELWERIEPILAWRYPRGDRRAASGSALVPEGIVYPQRSGL